MHYLIMLYCINAMRAKTEQKSPADGLTLLL